MKKVTALLLCLLMIVSVFAACSQKDKEKNDEDYKGTIIPVYINSEVVNFDPATAYNDEAAAQIISLLYEGLFRLDEDGKPVKGMCSSYTDRSKPEDNYYMMEFRVKGTWSDGRSVQAADFVYAFKRILEPEFRGEGANLLFQIKNARKVMAGDLSIDDLGVVAVGTYILRIEFEGKPDLDLFFRNLASPLLVPLREDAVTKVSDWSSNTSVLVTNGPFEVRTIDYGKTLVLERNIYYKRSVKKDALDKYVVPYRLVVNFNMSAEENLDYFNEGYLTFNSNLPLAKRSEYQDKVKVVDTMTEMTYVFNTTNPLFSKTEVRRALSIALDRETIAGILVYAKPAAGLIADKVVDSGKIKKSFRENGGELISKNANVDEAKSLLSAAGVKGGTINITIRDNEVDRAVAEYTVGVWEKLGFDVNIRTLKVNKYKENDYDLLKDNFTNAYDTGDFEVILTDTTMISTDAFGNLAQYALPFAGGKMDLASGDFDLKPHISGYSNEAYDELIEAAFAAEDQNTRSQALHDAEKLLIEDAPVVPLVVYQNAYLVNNDLKKISTDYYGFTDFRGAVLGNEKFYLDTKPIDESEF